MSEEKVKKEGDCYGTYDPQDPACTKECKSSQRCKEQTEKSGKPVAVEQPELTTDESMETDMAPPDFLLSLMQGRYSVKTTQKDGVTKYILRDKKNDVQMVVRAADDGGYFFRSRTTELQVDCLQSVGHAKRLWLAMV